MAEHVKINLQPVNFTGAYIKLTLLLQEAAPASPFPNMESNAPSNQARIFPEIISDAKPEPYGSEFDVPEPQAIRQAQLAKRISVKKTQKAACKETIELFSTLITRKIKDIDTLIDSLPSEASTKQLQNAALEKMHNENEKQGDELERQGIKDFISIEKQQF